MLSLKHILVAADFSPISIVALRHALGIARRYHSNVSLLHVIDPSIYGAAGPDGISADTECASRDAERIEAGLRGDGSLEGLKFDSPVSVGRCGGRSQTQLKTSALPHSCLALTAAPGSANWRWDRSRNLLSGKRPARC